jgi:hypothetical protein
MHVGICEWTTLPASFAEEHAASRAAGAGAIGTLVLGRDRVSDARGKPRRSGAAVGE